MKKTEIVKSTIDCVEESLADETAERLTLDDLAQKVGYSKFYLGRLFQEHVGTTIHQYMIERRLTEAAKKLVDTRKPVVEIAYEAGYQSQQAFTNAFSNLYLCAPSDYRCAGVWTPLRTRHAACRMPRMALHASLGVAA